VASDLRPDLQGAGDDQGGDSRSDRPVRGQSAAGNRAVLGRDYGIPFVSTPHEVQMDGWVKRKEGFRHYWLSQQRNKVGKWRTIQFRIESCTVPEPYTVYWKVRNTGVGRLKDRRLPPFAALAPSRPARSSLSYRPEAGVARRGVGRLLLWSRGSAARHRNGDIWITRPPRRGVIALPRKGARAEKNLDNSYPVIGAVRSTFLS
jgi:hypothetical protein